MDTAQSNEQDIDTNSDNRVFVEDTLDNSIDNEFLETIKKLQLDLSDKSSECEILRIRLDESVREVDVLSQELNECKLSMFVNEEDSNKFHEEAVKSKKLEEDYVKLMSQFLELGEKNEQYKQNIFENYLAKTNAINNLESFLSSNCLEEELSNCKLELKETIAKNNLASAKIRNLEEDNITKDKSIAELRKTLEDAKISHKHEITVLEDYIQCLKNTIGSYEQTLSTYSEPKPQEIEQS